MDISIDLGSFPFELYELFPQKTYTLYQSRPHILWGMLNPYMLATLKTLREKFGVATINNWYWGGANQYRCFRPADCTVGAELSQHRLGNAADVSFKDSAEEIRTYILNHPEEFPYIRAMEMNVSWLHFDCRFVPDWNGQILQFYP